MNMKQNHWIVSEYDLISYSNQLHTIGIHLDIFSGATTDIQIDYEGHTVTLKKSLSFTSNNRGRLFTKEKTLSRVLTSCHMEFLSLNSSILSKLAECVSCTEIHANQPCYNYLEGVLRLLDT